MNKKYIMGFLLILILLALGMYLYSRYSNHQAQQSANEYLQSAESTPAEASPIQDTSSAESQAETNSSANFSGTVALSPENTKLAWIGRKTLVVGYEDAGSISIKSGRAEIKDNKVVSAEAIIDMATIKTLKSGKGKDEDKLTGHLKSEDFFNVEQYPTSELKISQAKLVSDSGGTQNYEFSGSLTMKGITAEVVFPGTVTFLGDKVTMQSETKLDRTKWGVNFGSSKLADSFIDDLFTLKIYIEAVIVK